MLRLLSFFDLKLKISLHWVCFTKILIIYTKIDEYHWKNCKLCIIEWACIFNFLIIFKWLQKRRKINEENAKIDKHHWTSLRTLLCISEWVCVFTQSIYPIRNILSKIYILLSQYRIINVLNEIINIFVIFRTKAVF